MVTKEATTPPVIGKAGRYTVFISPPATPRLAEASGPHTPSPRNVASEAFRTRLSSTDVSPRGVDLAPAKAQNPSPAAVEASLPPVQVPPPQYAKGFGKAWSGSGVSGFFWVAVAKAQRVQSSLDEYLADWLGLDQSRYQWALNDYYENNEKSSCV